MGRRSKARKEGKDAGRDAGGEARRQRREEIDEAIAGDERFAAAKSDPVRLRAAAGRALRAT